MWKQVIGGLRLLLVLTIITGVMYPLAMTGFAQAVFPKQANGSMAYVNDKVVGSMLLGQNFTSEKYFHGRPSAAGADGYDATSSSGTNMGATSKKLIATATDNLAKVRAENNLATDAVVPSELVLASASGLDADISPEAAYLQVQRIASERDLPEAKVRSIVDNNVQSRTLGLLGEPRVNVLALNMALDQVTGE